MMETEKRKKADVHYRAADFPKDQGLVSQSAVHESCGTCAWFRGASCLRVEGPIQSTMLCDIYLRG